MKLRSKFTLLLLVGAVLLAAPAMALITDMGPNILPAPTSQSDKANIDAPGGKPSGNPSGNPDSNTSPAIQSGRSDIAEPSASTLPVQKIRSNKADYAPGARVTLGGSYWQPGESVRIDVNDDAGKTWSRNVDVRADASGRIQDQFQLPERFVATYEVTAMGAQSGVATTSFTESNVSFGSASSAPAGRSVNYRKHGGKNTSCDTGGTDACLSEDPGSTNGNITSLIAHSESAKQSPVAQPQPIVNTDEDTAQTITLSGTDEDGDDLSFFIVTAPNHGTLGPIGELTCAGTAPRICSANVTYTPDGDYNGFDIFSFKASDGTEASYPAPVSILVNPVNDTPVATDETRTTSEDGGLLSIDFGALPSDVETSDANLTYDITNPDPAKGSLGGTGSTRTFTPAANFNGTVDIGYTLVDRGDPDKCSAANPPCAAASISAQKTVSVTVDAVNDAPSFIRGPDQTKDEDSGAQSVPNWATAISAGPADENGQQLTFQVTNDNNNLFTSGGQPSVAPNGALTYTPADNANGTATVTVKLHDDGDTANGEVNQSAEQTFTITVGAVNDAPLAHADTAMIDEDTKLVFPSSDLVGNDDEGADNESSQTLSVRKVYEGIHGTVSLGNDGNITFTPEANFGGDASFTYLVCDDGNPSECSVQRAPVDLTVSPVNDAPVAGDQSVTTDEDTAREVTLSASDVEGDALGYTIVSAPRHGTLSGTGANLTYTPDADYNGPDRFTFRASDGTANSGPATVSIAVAAVNDAPVANDDTTSTSEDTPLVIPASQLLGNDDPGPANESGQTLTLTAVDQALNGEVSLGANGDITFAPDAGFNGQASFEYTVCDNGSPSQCSETIAIVNVAMSQVNDAPGFTAGPNQTVAEDSGAHSVPGWATGISAGPAEESGQALSFQVSNSNTSLFSAQPEVTPEGKLIYTPAANVSGSADVSVRLEDNGGIANGGVDESAKQTFTINVTAVNDAPIVSNLQGDGAANEGDVKTYTLDIADVDSSTFSASVDCGGAGKGRLVAGSLQMTATSGEFECKFLDGLLSPTPVNISVQLSDGEKLSNVETKSVSVSNVAPTLTGVSSSSQNTLAGTLNPVTFTPTATDASPRDLAAGFSYQWTIDGGAYGPVGDANQLYFSTCGTHTVEAQATDKDGGVSATSPQATKSVNVYDAAFGPPLVDGSTNLVQKGHILPVNISIGCGTSNLTNLTPHIQLLSGNVSPESEIGSTTVTSTPVSAADTTQTMRPVDGGYVYNLQVPTNAAANTEYTILVNPFGPTADDAATGMYLVIKIRK